MKPYYLMKETTNWGSDPGSNGFYIFKDKPKNRLNKAIGYVTPTGSELKWFTQPLAIDFKGREFVEIT